MRGAFDNFTDSAITEVNTGAIYSSSMARLVLTSTTAPKRFTTQAFSVKQGSNYLVKMWVKASQGRVSTGFFD